MSSPGADDWTANAEALKRRCAESYVEAWRRFARMTRGALEESDGATRIASMIPNAHFNPMFVTRPPRDPERALAEAAAFFARQGMPWNLVAIGCSGRGAEALEEAAERAGLERAAVNPGMVLAPIPAKEDAPGAAGLSIEVVDTPGDLVTYTGLLSEGFETPLELLAPLNEPETLGELDVTRYLGRAGGAPAVTGLRSTVNRVAVIFNVVTLPPWRRQGFGRAITLRAARDGLAEGCVASFLQSTMMGFSVYLRAGYRHVVDFHVWTLKRE